MQHQKRTRIEFGKFNFASDYDHCRYYLRRFATTIYNALFVSAVFDLFPGVRSVRQARFFWTFAISADYYHFYPIVILNSFDLFCFFWWVKMGHVSIEFDEGAHLRGS